MARSVLEPLWRRTTPVLTWNAYHVTHKVQSAFAVCLVHLKGSLAPLE